MGQPRISASSYSNTAPLVWSFLYGSAHGSVELIMDNAPARSAELLLHDRVDAALVPVIGYQTIPGVALVPDVCVGATRRVQSVCLVTKGTDLESVRSVSLDISSRTSAVLTKIIFREFLGNEPEWRDSPPDLDAMLSDSDAALLIGDPALMIDMSRYRKYDLAELWHQFTGLGFIFAMWMTRRPSIDIDFSGARDEGLAHLDEIAQNYRPAIGLDADEMTNYLSKSISYHIDDEMLRGMQLYFELAHKSGLTPKNRDLTFV